MAVSLVAGSNEGGVKLPCILYEGVATVTANVMGPDGYTDTAIAFASPLVKDQWVVCDTQVEDTYAGTGGVPVVKAIASGSLIIGQIITEPKMYRMPLVTPAGTWAAHLLGGYYRVATVWFPCVTGTVKVQVQGLSAANIIPGVQATAEVDASLTTAAAVAGNPDTLVCSDVTSGGVGMFSFHYIASGAVLVNALMGLTGGVVLITA